MSEELKAPHEFAMAGYSIACRYGVLEGRAFRLADEMFAAFKVIERPVESVSADEFCDANCVWTNHAPGCVRATPSPSPASDAELPQASAEEVETARLAAAHYGRPESDIPALIAFERHRAEQSKIPGIPGLGGAIPNFVAGYRAASTRTASDTRTAAGEAECDAAMRAAPASQQDARESARRFGITQVMLEQERVKNAHLLDVLMSIYRLSPRGEDIKLPDGRVLRFNDPNAAETLNALGRAIHAIPEKCAKALATRSRAEGGNTKEAALQELVNIAQANNMGYGPPAVDVEVEREFEAWFEGWRVSTWKPLPSDIAKGRAECPKHWNMNAKMHMRMGWLAARTQADAGKDADTLRAELLRLRGWFESQARVISKGGGSSWDMAQCREQIESIDATTKPENP